MPACSETRQHPSQLAWRQRERERVFESDKTSICERNMKLENTPSRDDTL